MSRYSVNFFLKIISLAFLSLWLSSPASAQRYELTRDDAYYMRSDPMCQNLLAYMESHDAWSVYHETGSFFDPDAADQIVTLPKVELEPAPFEVAILLSFQLTLQWHNIDNVRRQRFGRDYTIQGTGEDYWFDRETGEKIVSETTTHNPNYGTEAEKRKYILAGLHMLTSGFEKYINTDDQAYYVNFDMNNDGEAERMLWVYYENGRVVRYFIDEYNNPDARFYQHDYTNDAMVMDDLFMYQDQVYGVSYIDTRSPEGRVIFNIKSFSNPYSLHDPFVKFSSYCIIDALPSE